ncbi:MAG TPA: cytochrome c [Acidimicrobiia bacterium]|nr:cytochrome c [Acidimicrobiia bacterium]
MRSWAEGALAIAVTLVLGAGLWLFTGEPVGEEPTDTTTPVVVDIEAAARGQVLASETGCLACHTIDGASGVGPTWKGVAGATRPLVSGEQVVADNAYLFNSIVDPPSQVVSGYEPVMPTTYSDQLTEQEINDLVEYIKSLS